MSKFDTDQFMVKAAADDLQHFVGRSQLAALCHAAKGDERAWFITRLVELAAAIHAMPRPYAQDGLGKRAVAHLHYFTGSADFYITERDASDEQLQAFGLADLFRDGGELGYISITELVANGAELDLHWTPKTLAAIEGI